MEDIIQKSFKINLSVLKFVGLYPSENNPIIVKVLGYALYFCLLIVGTVLTIVNIFISKESSDMQRNLLRLFAGETFFFWFKVFPFLNRGEKIKKCINFFAHQNFAPRNSIEKESTHECIRICRRNSTAYFYGVLLAELLWNTSLIFAKDKLAMYLWLPYDPTSTNLAYYFTLLYALLVYVYVGFAGTVTDPLIGGLAYHATTQIKILKYNLQYLDRHVYAPTNAKSNDYSIIKYKMAYKHLKRCVNHHNSILSFFVDYEDCFSWCVFWQFASTMMALCFCCIGSTLHGLTSVNGVIYIIYFLVISCQILFYCYYGTLLYEENNTLMDAIYMGSWYRYDVKIKRVLVMIMERSKRQMIFTAGTIVNVTLETFVSALKTSYSLMAVLNSFSK